MAGISRSFATAGVRKRLAADVFAAGGSGLTSFPAWSAPALAVFRRNAHENAYEKNVEDQLNPTNVPDEVIKPESDKYWAPNPKTGVFGPDSEIQPGGGGTASRGTSSAGLNSALEEKAWFRPTSLEDMEKSP
uniref:Late embryogenesis abundant protein n=1 Tax=Kalanchoe fedtschenkoi TaxID=63787 RepID=A0A7N0VBG6_KALFE